MEKIGSSKMSKDKSLVDPEKKCLQKLVFQRLSDGEIEIPLGWETFRASSQLDNKTGEIGYLFVLRKYIGIPSPKKEKLAGEELDLNNIF